MKVSILVSKSAGNETVGDMWTEVLIFDGTATLNEVIDKIHPWNENRQICLRNDIKIQVPVLCDKEQKDA